MGSVRIPHTPQPPNIEKILHGRSLAGGSRYALAPHVDPHARRTGQNRIVEEKERNGLVYASVRQRKEGELPWHGLDKEQKMTKAPYRILVADDEEQIQFLWRSALLKPASAYEVVTVCDGCKALDQVMRAPFDLIVTDIMMPGMGGVELTEALRQLGYQGAVIWISALAVPEMAKQARRLNVYCCLAKPLRVAHIRQAVAEAIENSQPLAS